MREFDQSLQLLPEGNPHQLRPVQKLGVALVSLGLLLTIVVNFGAPSSVGWAGLGLIVAGAMVYILNLLKDTPAGIKNHYIMFGSSTRRGLIGWGLAVFMTGFYVLLYFYPTFLSGLIQTVDPVKVWLSGDSALADGVIKDGDQWFLYGFLYTLAVTIMGVRAIIKYRHNRYQILRTCSVMFFQFAIAFTLPNILLALKQPYFEWTNVWPLRYYELWPGNVTNLLNSGKIGYFMFFWGMLSILLFTPVLTYFFGKRWYCSWVCGCGGLAETLGDPFRQNSDKSLKAWKVERFLIHGVLVFILVTTAVIWIHHGLGGEGFLKKASGDLATWYGFLIGAIFSGVVGTGFYPIMGSRVWCRFGCPMAAILGLQQRFFSRFRISTNGAQCISCGNCSTYCEMGIDVRWYAQRQQNIVRASCVGCGVCSAVCPRGVLKLENDHPSDRMAWPV